MLVALTGKAGCGKSTLADYLETRHHFARLRFATPLKAMLKAFGLTDEHIEGRLKQVPTPLLCGKTPRDAMITLGTEWGRDLIGPNLWTDAWQRDFDLLKGAGRDVVTEDLRFENECGVIRTNGGVVIRILRPSSAEIAPSSHVSERGDFEADATIINDCSLDTLYARLDAALDALSFVER